MLSFISSRKHFLAISVLFFLFLTVYTQCTPAYARGILTYDRSRDTALEIVVVSPGRTARLRPGMPLVFDVLVFSENIDSVTVIVCGVPYKAVLVDSGPPYRYMLRLNISASGLYSWIIVLHYNDGNVRNSCIGRTYVNIVGMQLIPHSNIMKRGTIMPI